MLLPRQEERDGCLVDDVIRLIHAEVDIEVAAVVGAEHVQQEGLHLSYGLMEEIDVA